MKSPSRDWPVRRVWNRYRSLSTIQFVIVCTVALATIFLLTSILTMIRLGADRALLESIRLAIPLLFALGAGSYTLRFLRWHSLVLRLVPSLTIRDSLRVYMAGFSLGLTPARAGEVLKFTLLKEATGVRELEGLPVFLIERATEAASFLALALAGVVATHASMGHVRASAFLFVLALPAMAAVSRLPGLIRRPKKATVGARRHLLDFLAGLRTVASLQSIGTALVCAIAARTCDALLFWVATHAVGLQVSLGTAAMAFGLAGLAGGLSLLPGGIGAVEGTMVATLAALGGNPDAALAAALLARFVTLWIWIPAGLWYAVRGAFESEVVTHRVATLAANRPGPW